MNSIRQIQALNKRELEAGVSPEASWHRDYDSAYVYIGGLPFEFSEGDIITIFSQFGEPVFVNLVRDKETGKSKGFAFLKYEDQRSTDLAVDNLGGATVMGRVLRVDHTRYKKKDDEDLGDNTMGYGAEPANGSESRKKRQTDDTGSEGEIERKPMLEEERELAKLMRSHDDDDPMKSYLIQQKKEEVEAALSKVKAKESRSRRHRKDDRDDRDDERSRRYRRPRDDSKDNVRDGYERSRRHGRDSPSPNTSPSREWRCRRRSASRENRKYQSLSPERRRHRRSASRERRDERSRSRERRRR